MDHLLYILEELLSQKRNVMENTLKQKQRYTSENPEANGTPNAIDRSTGVEVAKAPRRRATTRKPTTGEPVQLHIGTDPS